MPVINPALLIQARKEANFSLEEAAKELGWKKPDTLKKLESGEKNPSSQQLGKIAKFYGYPALSFFLKELPSTGNLGEDFRTIQQQGELSFKERRDLRVLLENTKAQQMILRSLREEEEYPPLTWPEEYASNQPSPQILGRRVREILTLDLSVYRKQQDGKKAFNYLRLLAEKCGIFVLLKGKSKKLNLNVFRGIAFSDTLAPVIVINDYDNERAKCFTILHEIAHLLLGENGVSGPFSTGKTERLCNDAAACALIDPAEIEILKNEFYSRDIDGVKHWGTLYGISITMSAYLLCKEKIISASRYQEIAQNQIQQAKKIQNTTQTKPGFANYYVVHKNHLGNSLVTLAQQAVYEGQLTPTKAAILLDVKPTGVYPLLDYKPKPPKRKRIAL